MDSDPPEPSHCPLTQRRNVHASTSTRPPGSSRGLRSDPVDEERWQPDRQAPPLPPGHPPTPQRPQLGTVNARPPIAASAAAGGAGRGSMQETDLPATNAFKGKHSSRAGTFNRRLTANTPMRGCTSTNRLPGGRTGGVANPNPQQRSGRSEPAAALLQAHCRPPDVCPAVLPSAVWASCSREAASFSALSTFCTQSRRFDNPARNTPCFFSSSPLTVRVFKMFSAEERKENSSQRVCQQNQPLQT